MIRATAALLLLSGAAHAQGQACASHDAVTAKLAADYGETRWAIGLASGGAVVELFASLETGTWTIVATTPNGIACLLTGGDAFEAMVERLPPPGVPG